MDDRYHQPTGIHNQPIPHHPGYGAPIATRKRVEKFLPEGLFICRLGLPPCLDRPGRTDDHAHTETECGCAHGSLDTMSRHADIHTGFVGLARKERLNCL